MKEIDTKSMILDSWIGDIIIHSYNIELATIKDIKAMLQYLSINGFDLYELQELSLKDLHYFFKMYVCMKFHLNIKEL